MTTTKVTLLSGILLMAPAVPHAFARSAAPITVEMASFGLQSDGSDATPAVMAALEKARAHKSAKLVFAPGRYDFWPDRATERHLFVSNNDEGLKRIAFPLIGMEDLVIDGGGATFVFHGHMVPFLIEDSKRIALTNLSFDFSRPFHSEAKVLEVADKHVDVAISDEFPYEVRSGVLVFTNGSKDVGPATTVTSGEVLYPYGSLLAFDPVKKETAYMAKDLYKLGTGVAATRIGPGKVRLALPKVSAEPGNVLVFGAEKRASPGVIVSHSSDVTLENVNIYHAGGMGVIAQFSENLILEDVQVMPPPGGKRIVSTTADATHFVNCRGKITLQDCIFRQQKDDATNIHGLYARITRILAPDRFEVQLVHPQQAGLDFIEAGTRLELVNGPSLQTRGIIDVKSVERLNKNFTIVKTEAALPPEITVGDAVADADANTATVLIKNCEIRGNRARGILLGSRGKTVVEGNTFHTPGAAILFEGDARFWFEQAGVRDVVIRDNVFENCNFGVWGTGCIQVGSGIADEFRKTSRYNSGIVIKDNLFQVFSPLPLLSMYSVDGLTFTGNRIEKTEAYPGSRLMDGKLFDVKHSGNVKLEDPIASEEKTPALQNQ